MSDKDLAEYIGEENRFILKVWNENGQCLYQRYFNEIPQLCVIFQNVLVFVTQHNELVSYNPEDMQVITLVHFGLNGVTTTHRIKLDGDVRVEDIRHLAYYKQFLLLAVRSDFVDGVQDISFYSIDCRDVIKESHYKAPCLNNYPKEPHHLFDLSQLYPSCTFLFFHDIGRTDKLDDNESKITEDIALVMKTKNSI